MKILAITNLFPNSKEPTRGIFNFQQFKALREQGLEIKIVAPVPWHHFSKLPAHEIIDGFDVHHPRYFMIPRIGRALYGVFFFLSVFKKVKQIDKQFKSDAIFATWAYPDGIGSFFCAKALKKPLFVKVHGSDVNMHGTYLLRRTQITYAFKRSNKVIAVSNALKQKLVSMGVPDNKIAVIPNGVDTELFKSLNMVECRKKLGLVLDKKIILYAGNFAQVKGVNILVEAFSELVRLRSNIMQVLVGDGPLEKMLREKVKALGIERDVVFAGRVIHDSMRYYMNACDLFCLPSLNEGCPNVVLEALACGKPVVATRVGGVGELIRDDSTGILVEPGNATALAEALKNVIDKKWDYDAIRNKSLGYSWVDNAAQLKEELDSALKLSVLTKVNIFKRSLKYVLSQIISKKIIIWKAKSSKKIALTFDDGPNKGFTPKVLEILKDRDVKATFFLVGKEVETNKNLAQLIVRDGHCVGMHSYLHNKFEKLEYKKKIAEMKKSNEIIKSLTGAISKLFRPPGGIISISQLLYCVKNRITTVMWSINSMDYTDISSEDIIKNSTGDNIHGGDVILFHDDNERTVKALPDTIDSLKARGFEFATIEELLK